MLTKYEKWYWSFIQKYEGRGWTKCNNPGYVEGHHVLPRGLFGKVDNQWIVFVTPREHYVLHLLLCKFTPLPMPMFWKKYTSREFSPARSIKAKSMAGSNHHLFGIGHSEKTITRMKSDPRCRSVEGKIGINNGSIYRFIEKGEEIPEGWVLGRGPDSEETREKKSKVDPSIRAVNSGKTFSESWINNLVSAASNRPYLECPICGKKCKGYAALGSHKRKHREN